MLQREQVITAVPIIKLFAWGRGREGRHITLSEKGFDRSNDLDPLETPYTGSTLDLIHGQVHPFHRTE
jgi:hypothetical protein